MKSLFITSLLALSSTSLATPLFSDLKARSTHFNAPKKRYSIKDEDTSGVGASDVNILTYALILEHVEDTFYREGLANFTAADFAAQGFDATFYANLQEVAYDEATHVAFLTSALQSVGANPPAACVYDFPYTDPKSFVTLASILEGVGVSAYLGAAADIASPDYLTAAGSILTVEARHVSYLRAAIGESPFPAPQDVPLDFDQVHSLAYQFFVSCPAPIPIPVHAFPVLKADVDGPVTSGMSILLETPGYALVYTGSTETQEGGMYAAWVTANGPVFAPAVAVDGGFTTVVPEGLDNGQSYVLLTMCGEILSDSTTAAGPALLEINNPVTTS